MVLPVPIALAVFPWDASHRSFACPLVLQPETGLGFVPFRFLTKASSRLQSLDRFIFDLWLVDSTLPVLQSQKIKKVKIEAAGQNTAWC